MTTALKKPPDPALSPPAAAPAPERRARVRYRVDQAITTRAFIANSYRSMPARVVDVSGGGIGLILAQPLEPGVRLNVEPEATHLPFEILADVVHVTALPDGTWRCGCALVWPLSEDEVRLLLS